MTTIQIGWLTIILAYNSAYYKNWNNLKQSSNSNFTASYH